MECGKYKYTYQGYGRSLALGVYFYDTKETLLGLWVLTRNKAMLSMRYDEYTYENDRLQVKDLSHYLKHLEWIEVK